MTKGAIKYLDLEMSVFLGFQDLTLGQVKADALHVDLGLGKKICRRMPARLAIIRIRIWLGISVNGKSQYY